MRITVTVVDLSNAWSADVLVDADPELPVSALAQHLAGHAPDSVVPLSRGSARRDARGPGGPTVALHDRAPVLYVGGKALDPAATLQDSGLLEGAVVSLDDPAGSLPDEPAGVEITKSLSAVVKTADSTILLCRIVAGETPAPARAVTH